jgi:hypothetical protein
MRGGKLPNKFLLHIHRVAEVACKQGKLIGEATINSAPLSAYLISILELRKWNLLVLPHTVKAGFNIYPISDEIYT